VAISPTQTPRLPLVRLSVLVVSVALVALTITWTFLGMRAVMDIGGACATGGPYVPVQPCPQGASVMLSVAIPVLLLATFAGTIVAATIKAPTLLLPMWVLLFGSLGWNFLEYAFKATDGVEIGWLVCGIVFEAMALPAAALLVVTGSSIPGEGTTSRRGRWWLLYVAVGVAGLMAGLWSFRSWS
jgi:hypothetical protein